MNFLNYFSHLVFGTTCICCGKYLSYNQALCEKCSSEIKLNLDSACKVCLKYVCICNELKPAFKRAFCVYEYDEVSKRAVIGLKDKNKTCNSFPMSRLMAEKVLDSHLKIDIVTNVPIHNSEKFSKMYNHSELLANDIAKILAKKYSNKILIKTRKTLKQHETNSNEQRKLNLLEAFEIKNKQGVKNKNILLIDDVLTTGNTANECSKALKRAGAKNVYICVFATTNNI